MNGVISPFHSSSCKKANGKRTLVLSPVNSNHGGTQRRFGVECNGDESNSRDDGRSLRVRFKRRDLLLFGGFLFSAAVLNGSSETGKLSGNQETAVAILFERFETVFRIHPSLLTDTRRSNTRGFVQEPFGYLMLALDQKNRHLRPLVLDSGEAVLLGTKDYSPPEGLGRVVSTRCYITVLQNGRNPRYVANALGEPAGKTKAGNPYGSGQPN